MPSVRTQVCLEQHTVKELHDKLEALKGKDNMIVIQCHYDGEEAEMTVLIQSDEMVVETLYW